MPGGGWQLGIDDIGNVLCVLFLSLILHITPAPPRHASRPHICSIIQFEEGHLYIGSSAYISLFFGDVSKYFCDFVSKSNTDTQQNGNEAASTIWRRESCEVGRHTEEMVATFMAPDFYNIYNKMWNILLSLSLSYHHLHPIKMCATSCISSWNTHLEISSHSWTLDSNKIGAQAQVQNVYSNFWETFCEFCPATKIHFAFIKENSEVTKS